MASKSKSKSTKFLAAVIAIMQSATNRGLEPAGAVNVLCVAIGFMAPFCKAEDAKGVRDAAMLLVKRARELEAAEEKGNAG